MVFSNTCWYVHLQGPNGAHVLLLAAVKEIHLYFSSFLK